jgi:hypothetical protein
MKTSHSGDGRRAAASTMSLIAESDRSAKSWLFQ